MDVGRTERSEFRQCIALIIIHTVTRKTRYRLRHRSLFQLNRLRPMAFRKDVGRTKRSEFWQWHRDGVWLSDSWKPLIINR